MSSPTFTSHSKSLVFHENILDPELDFLECRIHCRRDRRSAAGAEKGRESGAVYGCGIAHIYGLAQ